jgi:mannose-1-phosphate guanylyltransferase
MYPKQFHSLLHDETMLQRTLQRLDGLEHQRPTVVCNDDHRFIVAEQARQIGIEDLSIILEPFGRNTAPAIAVAALHALQQGDDPVLLVLTADHEIPDQQAFTDVVRQALPLAEAGNLVTFGIVPTYAATGYGYIKRGQQTGAGFRVDEFVEKPDHATAEQYLAAEEYYWNSGMFMFRARRRRLRRVRGRFDRLRRHGKNRPCLRGADGCRLERHRQLVVTVGTGRERRPG